MEKCAKLEPEQFCELRNAQTSFSSSANFQRFTYIFPSTAVLHPKRTCCALDYQGKVPERLNLPWWTSLLYTCFVYLKKLVLKPQSTPKSFKAFIKATTTTREQIMKLRLQNVFILDLIYFPICVGHVFEALLFRKNRKHFHSTFTNCRKIPQSSSETCIWYKFWNCV